MGFNPKVSKHSPGLSPSPHTRSFRLCHVGALGVDGDIVFGIDGLGFDSEAVRGVRGDLLGVDGFCGAVFAGYGGIDSNRGWGDAQDWFRPGV